MTYVDIYNMSSSSSNISLNISEKKQQQQTQPQPQTQPSIKIENENENENVSLYIKQLTEQQKIVLNIAKEHLATSFCIEKSLGYLNWLKLKN